MQSIFPKEIINTTVEVHTFKHTNKSKIIYSLILLLLIISIVSLPFIKVTIYNTSQGVIRPDKERITIQTINGGKVVSHDLKNNHKVKKGDTLLSLNNMALTQKFENADKQLKETYAFLNDLGFLSKQKNLLIN